MPEFKFAMVEDAIEPGCVPATSPSLQQAIEALGSGKAQNYTATSVFSA